jgi:hypothetical protein
MCQHHRVWNFRSRKLKKELRRVDPDVLTTKRNGERVIFEHWYHSDGKLPWQDAATPLRWEGAIAQALDLLATLPDAPEGANDFWKRFCPQAEAYHRDSDEWFDERQRLEAELSRFGRLRPRATFRGYDNPTTRLLQTVREGRRPAQPWTHGLYAEEGGVRGAGDKRGLVDLNLRWRGTTEDALSRMTPLPDGCRSEVFWGAFSGSGAVDQTEETKRSEYARAATNHERGNGRTDPRT